MFWDILFQILFYIVCAIFLCICLREVFRKGQYKKFCDACQSGIRSTDPLGYGGTKCPKCGGTDLKKRGDA